MTPHLLSLIILKTKLTGNKPTVINITGTNGKTTTAKIIEHVLTSLNYRVGLASSIGLYRNGRRIRKKDRTGPDTYDYLFRHRNDFDILICENVLRHIKERNFFPLRADICIVTNVSDDHLHQTKSGKVTELAEIKETIINQSKQRNVVILNGDNKYTLGMAQNKTIDKIVLVSIYRNNVEKLLKYKPKAIYLFDNDKFIRIVNRQEELLIRNVSEIPITLELKLKFNIYNLLFSIAVFDSLSIPPNIQNDKLGKITLDYKDIPGRFNIVYFKDFIVILDNAHNPESYKEAFQTALEIPHKRIVSIIKASSTRSKDFTKKLAEISTKYSDFIYLKESFARNSPKKHKCGGKVAETLLKGIKETDFQLENVKTILDEEEAVKDALRNSRKGDIIMIFGYRIERINEVLVNYRRSLSS